MDFSLPAFLPLWFMAWQLGMRTGSSCTSHLSQSLPWGHHVVFAPLASGHRQALTCWCYKRNSGGPAPGTLYFFFFPQKEDPSCTSYLLLVFQDILLPTPSVVQVDHYSLLLPHASKTIWFFPLAFLPEPLQDLQLSWQFSVLTERLCLFSPGSPSQHSSAFNSLLLCQDSLQEWGLL